MQSRSAWHQQAYPWAYQRAYQRAYPWAYQRTYQRIYPWAQACVACYPLCHQPCDSLLARHNKLHTHSAHHKSNACDVHPMLAGHVPMNGQQP